MSGSDALVGLSEKLDVLIRIQAALAIKDLPTQKDKIVFLHGVGLGANYIASLLGTTRNTVSVAMAKHKKATATKGDTSND